MFAGKKIRLEIFLLFLVLLFLVFGLVMIADVSMVQAQDVFHDKFYFLKNQALGIFLGTFVCLFFAKFNYQSLKKLSVPIYWANLMLLALVFLSKVSIKAYGARRWLNFGILTFQPSELMKLSLVIYLSSLLAKEEKPPLWQMLFLVILPTALIILQPDFGSAALLVICAGATLFLGGENLKSLLVIALFGLVSAALLIFSSPYRRERVFGLLDPFYDPLGKSYHVYQMALTLGSGDWFGTGFGNSRQKYQYLPETTTDSIVAVAAEEFGFVGILVFITAFTFLVFSCLKVAFLAKDSFGKILAGGIATLIAFQGAVNLGAVAMIIPLTGVPFPFVSYGRSSLLVFLTAVGILINISKNSKKVKDKIQLV